MYGFRKWMFFAVIFVQIALVAVLLYVGFHFLAKIW